MKLPLEPADFAHLAMQKASFEDTDLTGSETPGAIGKGGATLTADFPLDKSFEMLSAGGATVSMAGAGLVQSERIEGTTATTASDRIEQVHDLINREIVMVRQSGADSLAVALKVDSHTDLLLQLTNHNGQIEAVVRLERGDVAALNGHWAQLKESLAEQNVNLLPLEDRTGSRGGSASTQNFGHQKTNGNGQPAGADEEGTASRSKAGTASTVNKSKTRKPPAKGWESWA